MKFWWLTDTPRLGAERRAVEALAAIEGWFELDRWRFHEGKLCAEGVIVAHAQRYAVRLVYPDQFPEVPAWVEPQEGARWTTHQYGAGTLCLQLRPDNWIPSTSKPGPRSCSIGRRDERGRASVLRRVYSLDGARLT